MSENGEIYTAGKKFTLTLAVTAVTNLTSGSQGPRGGSLGPRATLFSGLFRLFVATSPEMCLPMSFSCAARNKTWGLDVQFYHRTKAQNAATRSLTHW